MRKIVTQTNSSGALYTTRAALAACQEAGIEQIDFILRHWTGDYGNLPYDYAVKNEKALFTKGVMVSIYPLPQDREVYVITPKGHRMTYLLLPEEYRPGPRLIPMRVPSEHLTEAPLQHTCRSNGQ